MMNSKMMKSGGMAKKGASAKTLPMVKKDGKMVPVFAADGKGKMAKGGMMKAKMAAGGGMMKAKTGMSGGASKGGIGEEVTVRGSGAARSSKARIY
jgi:hypothetical protein